MCPDPMPYYTTRTPHATCLANKTYANLQDLKKKMKFILFPHKTPDIYSKNPGILRKIHAGVCCTGRWVAPPPPPPPRGRQGWREWPAGGARAWHGVETRAGGRACPLWGGPRCGGHAQVTCYQSVARLANLLLLGCRPSCQSGGRLGRLGWAVVGAGAGCRAYVCGTVTLRRPWVTLRDCATVDFQPLDGVGEDFDPSQ